jgi:hypothetical protein
MSKPKKPSLSLPKAKPVPVVDDARAASFLTGQDSPGKPKRGRPPKPEGSKAATWEKLTIYLPVDVATALRHRAVDERCDLSDVVAKAVSVFLSPEK